MPVVVLDADGIWRRAAEAREDAILALIGFVAKVYNVKLVSWSWALLIVSGKTRSCEMLSHEDIEVVKNKGLAICLLPTGGTASVAGASETYLQYRCVLVRNRDSSDRSIL
jgi:hypothetical protein